MNKALIVFLLIFLQIGIVTAGIEVRNATTIWNATFVNVSSTNITNITDRIAVEYANTVYTSNMTPGIDPNVPDRIIIDHANAVYNPYLLTTPLDFNPNVTRRIIIQSANALWNPELSSPRLFFVDINNSAFNKNVITIPIDTTVTWINFDSVLHTVTADDGSFDSGNLQRNQSFSRTFNIPGTYHYHCSIHPSITGTVIVIASPASGPFQVMNPSANPAIILNDNGRARPPGTNITRLNVTVTGNVSGVTIDLSPIGRSAATPMTRIPGTDIYTITTNATSCKNFPNNLLVNATETSGNFNNSVGIPLTVVLPGDVNFDCKIDLKDLLFLRRHLAGLEPWI